MFGILFPHTSEARTHCRCNIVVSTMVGGSISAGAKVSVITGVVSTFTLVSRMAAFSVPSLLNHKSVLAATVTASVLVAACIGGWSKAEEEEGHCQWEDGQGWELHSWVVGRLSESQKLRLWSNWWFCQFILPAQDFILLTHWYTANGSLTMQDHRMPASVKGIFPHQLAPASNCAPASKGYFFFTWSPALGFGKRVPPSNLYSFTD